MIRVSEAVLPGHPDKFCDQIADAIVAECYRVDPRAYCQVEAAVWSDQVWLSGGIATRTPFERPLDDIVREVGRSIGYVAGNAIDAERYKVTDVVCKFVRDPREWTNHVNDQSIVIGWAGYDAKTDYVSPEHFLADRLRSALFDGCLSGSLAGNGPDGKLLVRLRENPNDWQVEHVLVTLQHLAEFDLVELSALVSEIAGAEYEALRSEDSRWSLEWDRVELCVNPNGPLHSGGSNGDNGQTGRKLAMDYYGPRIPIGGGAIFGKDLSHIDRAGAYETRRLAVEAVQSGATECKVVACYAPNIDIPLDVNFGIEGGVRPPANARERLSHNELWKNWLPNDVDGKSPLWSPAGKRGLRGIC
jgi:S-adenosylmethionine synthetase